MEYNYEYYNNYNYLLAGKKRIDGNRFMLYSHGKSLLSPSTLTNKR